MAEAHAQPPRQVAFYARLEAVAQKRFSNDIHRRSPEQAGSPPEQRQCPAQPDPRAATPQLPVRKRRPGEHFAIHQAVGRAHHAAIHRIQNGVQAAFQWLFCFAVDDRVQTQQLMTAPSMTAASTLRSSAHEHAARARLKLHAMHHARAEQLLPVPGLIHAARKGRHIQPLWPGMLARTRESL